MGVQPACQVCKGRAAVGTAPRRTPGTPRDLLPELVLVPAKPWADSPIRISLPVKRLCVLQPLQHRYKKDTTLGTPGVQSRV